MFIAENDGAESIIVGLKRANYIGNPFGEFTIRDTIAKIAKQEGLYTP